MTPARFQAALAWHRIRGHRVVWHSEILRMEPFEQTGELDSWDIRWRRTQESYTCEPCGLKMTGNYD